MDKRDSVVSHHGDAGNLFSDTPFCAEIMAGGVQCRRKRMGLMNENNSYSEYAVEVYQTGAMKFKRVAVIGVTAVSLVLALMVYWVFLALTAAGAVGCYLTYLSSSMEYETIFLDGTLEISAIYQKMRRKKKFQCEMKSVAGYHLGKKEDAVRLGKITKDYSSHVKGRTCCVIKVNTEKSNQVICFEPGKELEEILEKRYRMLKV